MRTSVIIVTRNRKNEIIRFLSSLNKQTLLPNELLIVDSSDKPLSESDDYNNAIYALNQNIHYQYLNSLPGTTRQRNLGIDNATGDLIFFFDDDVVLYKDYIEIISRDFRKHSDYAGGGGAMVGVKHHPLDPFYRFWMLLTNVGSGRFKLSGFPSTPYGRNSFMKTQMLIGAAACYRKKIFEEFRFDENLTGYCYMEDDDFSFRISRKYKLFYDPKAKFLHLHGKKGRGNFYEHCHMSMYNYTYFFFKNIYPTNKLRILFYLWAVMGHFFMACIVNRSVGQIRRAWKAYYHALIDYRRLFK